jgi:probable uridylyltransferase SH0870
MANYVEIVKKYNQEHLLKYIDLISTNEGKNNLINDIENIDFEKLNRLFALSNQNFKNSMKTVMLEHIRVFDKSRFSDEENNEILKIGEDIIANNQYAVVTMAGGQGTRLGHKGPKGTFILNVKPEPKSLFQIIAENLIKANNKYGIILNWYIMTSTENNDETVKYFEDNNYFGYNSENVKFFKQGNLPLLSEDGKLVINSEYRIKYAASGNGTIYQAMLNDGVIDDMKRKGIKWVFIGSVDNALLNMVDPMLLGLTKKRGTEIASKTIVKNSPYEKVGVFCKKNGKPGVIEYSEIPETLIEEVDENGELMYGESHIMCNLYTLDAIEKIANVELPYHSAHKKVDFMQEDGNMFYAKEANGHKYEAFIFDGFELFDDITLYRGKREEDFAPVKNAEGVDSPETATKLYNDFWFKD